MNNENVFYIKNETPTSADLYFYGDIVSDKWDAWTSDDKYPAIVRDLLNSVKGKNLNIYINSAGGSVFAGMAIYNMLKRHSGKKTVYVDGMAASIASVIALAGDKVIIPSNAFLMIHQPWSFCVGNSNDLRKMAEDLDNIEKGLINVYQEHLTNEIEVSEIIKMMENETWINGVDAAKYFNNVETGQPKNIAAKFTPTMNNYKNIPKQFVNTDTNADNKKDAIKRILINSISKTEGV